MPEWFAVYTIARHEKQVHECLIDRGIESFLPVYQEERLWKKRSPVLLTLPLFPAYIFVRITRNERSRVLSTPGVLSIVGSPARPWPLLDSEVETLRLGVANRKIAPSPFLAYGERVRIKSGVMAGVEGILTRSTNQCRVVLTIECIMRSFAIEIDGGNLEMVGSGSDRSNTSLSGIA